jgi:hypothetical protein
MISTAKSLIRANYILTGLFALAAVVHAAKLFSRIMCGRYSAPGTLSEPAKLIDFICRAFLLIWVKHLIAPEWICWQL